MLNGNHIKMPSFVSIFTVFFLLQKTISEKGNSTEHIIHFPDTKFAITAYCFKLCELNVAVMHLTAFL